MHDEELRSHELTSYIAAIQRVSRPCLVGKITHSVSDCYFGGMPLLPVDFQWPLKGGYPLSFIGQLRCSDVDLVPTNDGNLLFFYDNRHWGYQASDLGHAVVVHVPSNASCSIAELPTCEVAAFFGFWRKTVRPQVYQRVNVVFESSTSYPSYERNLVSFADDDAEERYLEFCSSLPSDIQLGGYPRPVQSDIMELDCVNALGLGKPDEWVLLLQLFEIGNMVWGDAGALYWFIHRDDLAENCFDRVWMVTQCA
ncbi:MAG: YwqG family protein [Pirellulales bacterium]